VANVAVIAMEPLFIGSHVAADFLNTAFEPDGGHVETIGNGREFFAWLVIAKLLDDDKAARLMRRLGAKGVDSAAAEARKLREWARDWLERWRKTPNANYDDDLKTLNSYLVRESRSRQVVKTKDGLFLSTQTQVDSVEELLALPAAAIASLLTEEDASLLRTCAGPGCTLWFLDRTKAHRRLFCSAATCGNRAKVAAFRERQKE
jgi:predicted RNA-binding Zn ribbon-like protein